MIIKREPISLIEYVKHTEPKYRISDSDGEKLWLHYNQQIQVGIPSFQNAHQWELTSQGYVGFIPVSEDLSISISPKTPIKNLFGMWEYAYRLKDIKFLGGLFESQSLQEFYSELANILAKRVIDRSRKGYYRTYLSRTEDLSYLKGKLDIRRMISAPWIVRPRCSFQEHTADIDENQILAWTLYAILRSGFCTERVLPSIRNAYRHIAHVVTLSPFHASDCIGRLYNRLNFDYEPLHALSRFFLENSGPSFEHGDRKMLPFLVDMAQLFELFVAEWMKIHLPEAYEVKPQESVDIDDAGNISIRIDLVLFQKQSGMPICVLDTKYKTPDKPSQDDIAQINLYADVMGCKQAILIYPEEISKPMDQVVGGIRIRTATFNIGGDLEKAGKAFLKDILEDQLIENF
jgi:5-methylcytosine-specific restriction enzyme subunit McrC